MFKELFKNPELYQYFVKYLTMLCNEVVWNDRLQFIYRKYYDRDSDNDFDIHLLYLVTYSIRGKMTPKYKFYDTNDRVTLTILEDILPLIYKYHKKCFYIHAIKASEEKDLTIKYGVKVILDINEYVSQTVKLLKYHGANFKVINNIEEITDNGNVILVPYASILPCFKPVNYQHYFKVIAPMPFTRSYNNDVWKKVSIFFLNLFNCCHGDTITDSENPYIVVPFNTITLNPTM